MSGINLILEMKALDAELEGMKAENEHRVRNGMSIAYGGEQFFEHAEKYRKLKGPAPIVLNPNPQDADDILAMNRDELTKTVDEQFARDFKGGKNDPDVMNIHMTI